MRKVPDGVDPTLWRRVITLLRDEGDYACEPGEVYEDAITVLEVSPLPADASDEQIQRAIAATFVRGKDGN